ncbi:hypothetical protein BGX21_006443 [Mortierella sp. AD011]|nr:hypothetical protein BGX20_006485 [Mortierella sp. AD010]KAF9399328.1 hypothetical protein BGX21_006443 [Mortierella sp. AD011]
MMLILSSQEFDPGKGVNWIAGLEALRVARVISMLNPESTSHIQSHEYLYTLDLPRIHRMLRPIKAKISAIHLAIKSSPSFGYAPVNVTTTNDVSSEDFPEDSYIVASRNVKQQYGQSRSLRTRHRGPQNYLGYRKNISIDSPSHQIYPNESTAASGSNTQNGSDTLVRRFRSSLIDLFRDVVEKVWWQPFCEDHDLPLNSTPTSILKTGLAPNSFTLAKSCAFAVGRIVAHIQEADPAQMEKYYNIMPDHMRRSEGNTHAESKEGLKDVALGLALHSLYIAVTNPSESDGDEKTQEWVRLLETRMAYGIRQLDFDVVVRSYGTLTNLNALALMLDAVGLYALSMKLMSRMLEDFYTLEKNTRKQLGYVCDITVSTLENQLREVEQRRIQHASSDLWRYDDVLGDWVERTPKPNKTILIVFDDDRSDSGYIEDSPAPQPENHGYSSYDLPSRSTKPFSLGSLPSEHAMRRFPQQDTVTRSSPSAQSNPATEQSSCRRRQTEESSPFVLRKKIRYSMTPIRRPVRSSRQRVYYNDFGPELGEDEEEEAEEEEGDSDRGTGFDIANIDTLTPSNDMSGEEEGNNGIDLEPTPSALSRLPYLDDDYVQPSGSNSDDSAQELSDGVVDEDLQDVDSGISSEGAPEAIVLSDGADDSSCSYENHGPSGGQDSSTGTDSESEQEAKQSRSRRTHAKIGGSRGDNDDYLAPRSARRKRSQDNVYDNQFSAPHRSKYGYNTRLSSSKDLATTESEEDSDIIAYQKRQPARPRRPLISTRQSESDDDFQPLRKSKVVIEQTVRPQRQTQRHAILPHVSNSQAPDSSRKALVRRAPSSTSTFESKKRTSDVTIECLSEDSNDSGVESSDLRRLRGKKTGLKSANSAYSLRSKRSLESSSGSDCIEIVAKKRIRNNTSYRAAKKIRRTIVSEEDTLQDETDCSDEESDCERNVFAASESENTEWLEENSAEDEDGESSDEDGDEEDTMGFCKEESAFSVGAPLPLTEPDELAFWMCEPV